MGDRPPKPGLGLQLWFASVLRFCTMAGFLLDCLRLGWLLQHTGEWACLEVEHDDEHIDRA